MASLTDFTESIDSIPADIREGLLRAAQYGCSLEQLTAWYRIVWEHYGFERLPSATNSSIEFHVPTAQVPQPYALRSPPYLQGHEYASGASADAPHYSGDPSFWTPPNSQVAPARGVPGPLLQSSTPALNREHYQRSPLSFASTTSTPHLNVAGTQGAFVTPNTSPGKDWHIHPTSNFPQTEFVAQDQVLYPSGPASHAAAFTDSPYGMANLQAGPGPSPDMPSSAQFVPAAPPIQVNQAAVPMTYAAGPSNKRQRPQEWASRQDLTSSRSSSSPTNPRPTRRQRIRLSDAASGSPMTSPNPGVGKGRPTPARSVEPAPQQMLMARYPSETTSSTQRQSPRLGFPPAHTGETMRDLARHHADLLQRTATANANIGSSDLTPSSLEEQPFDFPMDFPVDFPVSSEEEDSLSTSTRPT